MPTIVRAVLAIDFRITSPLRGLKPSTRSLTNSSIAFRITSPLRGLKLASFNTELFNSSFRITSPLRGLKPHVLPYGL